MNLLLYAIAEADHPDPSWAPLPEGPPLQTIRAADLTAIVGPAGVSGSADPAAEMWEFGRTLTRLQSDGTILPARYGTVLADEAAVRTVLGARRSQFAERLSQVRGAEEFALRARPTGPNDPPEADGAGARPVTSAGDGAGTAYLLSRLAARRQEEAVEVALVAAVAEVTRDRVPGRRAGGDITLACLVDRQHVDAFTTRVAELRDALAPGVELTCTGPWPPFSFSGERQ